MEANLWVVMALWLGLMPSGEPVPQSGSLGVALIERAGGFGSRAQVEHWFGPAGDGFGLAAEGSLDPAMTLWAAGLRYRWGHEHAAVWPLVGWRGQWNGLQGPECGLGGEVGFGAGTAAVRGEAGWTFGLNGQVATGIRLSSRYRVLRPFDLEASYRLESWPAWSQVWGLGVNLVW